MPCRRPHQAVVVLTSIGALALSACGGSSSDSSSSGGTTPAAAPEGASTVKLSADAGGALKFNTTKLTAKAGTVTVEMHNPSGSGVPHAIAVEGNGVDQDGKTVSPGGTSTDTLKLKPGTYTFYCPVPGHEDAGMKGTLTVS